jgi:hypothetical protein
VISEFGKLVRDLLKENETKEVVRDVLYYGDPDTCVIEFKSKKIDDQLALINNQLETQLATFTNESESGVPEKIHDVGETALAKIDQANTQEIAKLEDDSSRQMENNKEQEVNS